MACSAGPSQLISHLPLASEHAAQRMPRKGQRDPGPNGGGAPPVHLHAPYPALALHYHLLCARRPPFHRPHHPQARRRAWPTPRPCPDRLHRAALRRHPSESQALRLDAPAARLPLRHPDLYHRRRWDVARRPLGPLPHLLGGARLGHRAAWGSRTLGVGDARAIRRRIHLLRPIVEVVEGGVETEADGDAVARRLVCEALPLGVHGA